MMDTSILILILLSVVNYTRGINFECSTGYWGHRCDRRCGNCEGGLHFCHVHDGLCVNGCAHGYQGPKCTKLCPEGRHGQYCREKCGRCSDEAPICDRVTGKCKKSCQVGYQMPYCKLRCPFMYYGKECRKRCDECEKKGGMWCGCEHISGECQPCDSKGEPLIYELDDPLTICLNQHIIKDYEGMEHNERTIKIPWVPIVTFLCFITLFVFGNFIYWYIWVRNPSKKESVRVDRKSMSGLQPVPSWGIIRRKVISTFEDGQEFRTPAIQHYLNRQTERLDRLLQAEKGSQDDHNIFGSFNTSKSSFNGLSTLKSWARDTAKSITSYTRARDTTKSISSNTSKY